MCKKSGTGKRYEKIPTTGMGREEWLSLRKTGIGGSDAGAVCGLNPYSSPMKVFRDKTSQEAEETDNEAIRQGNDLEEYVAQRFIEATGLKVRRSHYLYRSLEHPFMLANVDRLVVGEDAGLECKTASAYSAGKWEKGEIPLHYLIQCYHYMAVTGKRTWYLAAVILGKDFTYRKLTWDDALIHQLIEMEQNFWENYVAQGKLPPPDGSRACDEVIEAYFHTAKRADQLKLTGFDEKLERREAILAAIADLQEEQKQIEQEVKLFMGEQEWAANDRYQVSWGNVDSVRLDTRRLKAERPEVYQEYATTSHSRRFCIKTA